MHAGAVADEAVMLLTDAAAHAQMREALGAVREKLSLPGASARAAAAVVEMARRATTPNVSGV